MGDRVGLVGDGRESRRPRLRHGHASDRHVDHAETRRAGPRSARRQPPRRPFRDNPRLILAGIGVLLAVLVALLAIANRTSQFSPDFLTEFVLYALSAADLTMLVALVFVLARNIIKLVVERRRALPFARFRAKLVALLLGMTLVPAVLVLIVGSELIRTSIDRWFNAPMEEILSSANQIAGDYYHERQMLVERSCEPARAGAGRRRSRRRRRPADPRPAGAGRDAAARADGGGVPRGAVERDRCPASSRWSTSPRRRCRAGTAAPRPIAWPRRRWPGRARPASIETLGAAGDLLHAAAVIRAKDGKPTGVVVATDYLTGDLAARSRRMTQAFEDYNQLRVLKRPLTGVYLSFFLMVTLLILVGATWMGLVPRQADHAAGADAGGRRARDRRGPPRSARRAAEQRRVRLAGRGVQHDGGRAGRRAAARSTAATIRARAEARRGRGPPPLHRDDSRAHHHRRRLGRRGRRDHARSTRAAARLLSLDRQIVGQPAPAVFDRADLQPLGALLAGAGAPGRGEPPRRRSRWRARARSCTSPRWRRALVGESGASEGVVLVLDDVTPLIRAQKVAAWREVARRLAHEIKNPLTPIQLSAERLRRHFAGAPPPARALVDECTATIVGEVESLKGLVDEFSQFARMPSPRTVPTDLRAAHHRHARALQRDLHRRAHRAALRAGRAAGPARPRADPARHHQPDRQRDRGDGAPRADRRRDAARRGQQRGPRHRRRRRPGHSGRRSARSCSCRTTRPSGAAAASASPSCAASSPSTAAASTSATTRRAAHGLQSSCRAERLASDDRSV